METLIQKLRAHSGLLTIAEVSELLGFHQVTLRNRVRAGKLRPSESVARGGLIRRSWGGEEDWMSNGGM